MYELIHVCGLTRGKIAVFSFSFERQLFEQKRMPESRRYG